jgi:magnesium-transporting ATPase (P-type)
MEIVITYYNNWKIKKMAEYSNEIDVEREGKSLRISTIDLVPGDLVTLPELISDGLQVPCDLVLVSG